MPLKLATLPVKDLRDLSAGLRRVADLLDSGEYDPACAAIVVLGYSDQDVRVYGYGNRANPLEISGWLSRAQFALTSMPNPERKPPRTDPAA